MSDADDECATLARLIPTAQRLADNQPDLMTWLATLTEQERLVILAWAQQQGLHWAETLSHDDEVSRRINDDLMP
jgi:hypothetical protein